MGCNCHSSTQERLRKHYAEKLPAGSTDLDVSLNGYVFGFSDDGMTHQAACPVEVEYQTPKKGKTPGMKRVKQKTFMRASFCPFCGLSYFKGSPAKPKCPDHPEGTTVHEDQEGNYYILPLPGQEDGTAQIYRNGRWVETEIGNSLIKNLQIAWD